MSTTIAVQYAIHKYFDQEFNKIAAKRIGIGVSSADKEVRQTLDSTPIVLGAINGFLFAQAGAPFVLSFTDMDSNPASLRVNGLFIGYIEAQTATISWDDVLQKESAIHIHYSV